MTVSRSRGTLPAALTDSGELVMTSLDLRERMEAVGISVGGALGGGLYACCYWIEQAQRRPLTSTELRRHVYEPMADLVGGLLVDEDEDGFQRRLPLALQGVLRDVVVGHDGLLREWPIEQLTERVRAHMQDELWPPVAVRR